jgi:hypothetical protein
LNTPLLILSFKAVIGMPEQLIFTSTPTGIVPGRSGFQVVAQHSSIHHRLILALEKESVYEFADSSQSLPVICKHLKFDFGEERFSVLSKLQACGVDFTGRPNHIAHHLVYSEKDLPKCPPAALFALWKGWRSKWTTSPRYLGGWDRINYEDDNQPFYYPKFALPAKTWKTYTGDEGAAALPVIDKQSICFNTSEGKEDALVWLFFESQSLIDVEAAWSIEFTNFLTESDNPNRFRWFGSQTGASPSSVGFDFKTMDVFTGNQESLKIPKHPLVDKARSHAEGDEAGVKRPTPSAVSIAPLEDDSGYVQEELILEKKLKLDGEDEGTLPIQHPDEDFDNIFKADEGKTELPELNLQDESEIEVEQVPLLRRLMPLFVVVALLACGVGAIYFAPVIVESMNRSKDPMQDQIDPEAEKARKLEVLNVDPEERFADQLGEVDSIIESGQFLLARAYLAKNRSDPNHIDDPDFQRLDQWFEEQKSILEMVNRETGSLGREVGEQKVIEDFDTRTASIQRGIDQLAHDLQPSVSQSLDIVIDQYAEWLDRVRLRTEDIPTVFVPVSFSEPNPEVEFSGLAEEVIDWFKKLEQFDITTRIESIDVKLSEFQGLNQFQLSTDSALNLTLWKVDERSLVCYLDGQTEIMTIETDVQYPDQMLLKWTYQPQGDLTETKSESRFPEPPMILNFINTVDDSGLNIVIAGGISAASLVPAEVPSTFLRSHSDDFRIEVSDPVLRRKLFNFVLPPDYFLRLRSLDDRFLFAWDRNSSDFHLYESRELNTPDVWKKQQQIADAHKYLTDLERQKVVFESVAFIMDTPLWSLGGEILPSKTRPVHFENFGTYNSDMNSRFFDYIRDLFIHFTSEYTLVKPDVMERWIAYPRQEFPESMDDIVAYRNLLLRTSKRLRNLLREDDPNTLEYWRQFVTNLEFWLLGEHQDKLIDILSLTESEIRLAAETDIARVDSEIETLKSNILELQNSLDEHSELKNVEQIDMWLLEMSSLDASSPTLPLILFK